MQNETVRDITSYIDFLRENGYCLSLSCFSPVLRPRLQELLMYEPHICRACTYLKSVPETRTKCIANKDALNAKKPREAYYYCCWAGVEEFVIPVIEADDVICCINLSGYRGRLEISRKLYERLSHRLSCEYALGYGELSADIPSENETDRIINPLKYMLRSLYRKCLLTPADTDRASEIYIHTLRYIYDHYMEHITAEDIASRLCYSSSHLRHIFLKKSGKTINETLTQVRLSAAERQLASTELSVTQTAVDCGFCDGNYFSAVFKKYRGISPKEYRAAARKKQ